MIFYNIKLVLLENQIFPLWAKIIWTSELLNLQKWCFYLLISLLLTFTKQPWFNNPYFVDLVWRLTVLSLFIAKWKFNYKNVF